MELCAGAAGGTGSRWKRTVGCCGGGGTAAGFFFAGDAARAAPFDAEGDGRALCCTAARIVVCARGSKVEFLAFL